MPTGLDDGHWGQVWWWHRPKGVVGTRKKHVPQRRCVICGEQRSKQELVRVVRTPAGDLVVDAGPKVSGRGAYVCRATDCLHKAADGKRIARVLQAGPVGEAAAALQSLAGEAPEKGPSPTAPGPESDVGR